MKKQLGQTYLSPLISWSRPKQVYNILSGQVATGLHCNMEKLYIAYEELRQQQGNAEDLSIHISQLEAHNQDFEGQCREHELNFLQQFLDFRRMVERMQMELETKIRQLAIKDIYTSKGSGKEKTKPQKEPSDVEMSDVVGELPEDSSQGFTE